MTLTLWPALVSRWSSGFAIVGAIGAGGLGNLAIHQGYPRFETGVLIAVVVVLIVLVSLIQFRGDRVSRGLDRR